MRRIQLAIPLLLVVSMCCVTSGVKPQHPTTRMGTFSAELKRESIIQVADAVAKYQLTQPATRPVNDKQWVRAAFYVGLAEYATAMQNKPFLDALREVARRNEWKLGPSDRFADDHCIGAVYAALYEIDKDPAMLAPMREQFDRHLQLPYDESLELKKGIVSREWAWCDALFMAPPTLARLSRVTGEPKYLDFMNRLWWKTTDYLLEPTNSLYFRDSRYFTKHEPNGQKVFWSRGNGWVVAGLARVLSDMPKDYPDRPKYEALFKSMCDRLLTLQRADGTWAMGLLDPKAWPAPESSGTGFFTYALAWGVNNGLLKGAGYELAAKKGWQAIVGNVYETGQLGWVQPIGAAPAKVSAGSKQAYGPGAFLLAATEMLKLADRP